MKHIKYAYGLLVGKYEGKYSSMTYWLGQDDIIKVEVKEMAYDCGMNSRVTLGYPAREPITILNTIARLLNVAQFGKEITYVSEAPTASILRI